MRYSTIFTTVFLALTSALGMPQNIAQADQLAIGTSDASNGFHWVDAMSKNGRPFRIGYPKANSGHILTERSGLAGGAGGSTLETREFKWYSVDWPVGDSSWKEVTNVPQLTKYALYENSQPRIYTYVLHVYLTNTGWGTTYTFEDQEGDEYALTAFTNGQHSIDFNSDAPRIKRVKTDQEF
ncbi:hypothetical protein MVEN_00797600 [Mycena venus]|uniref:Uncharacterized protein n=1 Tax=Mycena venus TaxID=2733690 RepID=A0A8H6YKG6_9AGAR|nr:hypothetical protein MVEN_00797600 [Mycena venus]